MKLVNKTNKNIDYYLIYDNTDSIVGGFLPVIRNLWVLERQIAKGHSSYEG